MTDNIVHIRTRTKNDQDQHGNAAICNTPISETACNQTTSATPRVTSIENKSARSKRRQVEACVCGEICAWWRSTVLSIRRTREITTVIYEDGREGGSCVVFVGGKAVPADRDFPDCEGAAGKDGSETERAGTANPVHKGHDRSDERDPKPPNGAKLREPKAHARAREAGPRAPTQLSDEKRKRKMFMRSRAQECIDDVQKERESRKWMLFIGRKKTGSPRGPKRGPTAHHGTEGSYEGKQLHRCGLLGPDKGVLATPLSLKGKKRYGSSDTEGGQCGRMRHGTVVWEDERWPCLGGGDEMCVPNETGRWEKRGPKDRRRELRLQTAKGSRKDGPESVPMAAGGRGVIVCEQMRLHERRRIELNGTRNGGQNETRPQRHEEPANAALAGGDSRAPRGGGAGVYVEIGQPSWGNDTTESVLSHSCNPKVKRRGGTASLCRRRTSATKAESRTQGRGMRVYVKITGVARRVRERLRGAQTAERHRWRGRDSRTGVRCIWTKALSGYGARKLRNGIAGTSEAVAWERAACVGGSGRTRDDAAPEGMYRV
ncbi:hypothetical protein B0H11DRAFT_1918434 [Mycena galericulata]|nr:hypothetical protein B0H11DRAFT_1918434 [Mycena galericulata]